MTVHNRQKLQQQTGERPGAAGESYHWFTDSQWDSTIVKIYPGGYYVTSGPGEVLMTLLGSCISACIRDPIAGIGGMNHFMLPDSDTGDWGGLSAAARYGNFAMELVINEILARGGQRNRLEVKLFGGGDVLSSGTLIGTKNVAFIRNYIQDEHLNVIAEDLGGTVGRRIHYFPETGKVMRKLFKRNTAVEQEEMRHLRKLRKQNIGGDVELFD